MSSSESQPSSMIRSESCNKEVIRLSSHIPQNILILINITCVVIEYMWTRCQKQIMSGKCQSWLHRMHNFCNIVTWIHILCINWMLGDENKRYSKESTTHKERRDESGIRSGFRALCLFLLNFCGGEFTITIDESCILSNFIFWIFLVLFRGLGRSSGSYPDLKGDEQGGGARLISGNAVRCPSFFQGLDETRFPVSIMYDEK